MKLKQVHLRNYQVEFRFWKRISYAYRIDSKGTVQERQGEKWSTIIPTSGKINLDGKQRFVKTLVKQHWGDK